MGRPSSGGGRGGGGGRSSGGSSRSSGGSSRSSSGSSMSGRRSSSGRTVGSSRSVNRPTGGSSRPGGGGGYGGPGYGGPGGPGRGGFFGGPGYGGPHYGGPRRRFFYGGRRGGGGCGCSSSFAALLFTIIVLGIIGVFHYIRPNTYQNNNQSSNVVVSSSNRTALASGSVNETDYYTDELDWIVSSSTLEKGMKSFYKQTGVQPYLYLAKPVSSTNTDSECAAFADALYDELFTDEAHILVVYVENLDPNEYGYLHMVVGSAATTVIDSEAEDILYGYIDSYWDLDYSEEELFSKAFSDTADNIMKQHTNANDVWRIVVIAAAVIVVLIILFIWWRARKKQKNKEQEDLERMLNKPLDTFGDKEMDDLTKKYDE